MADCGLPVAFTEVGTIALSTPAAQILVSYRDRLAFMRDAAANAKPTEIGVLWSNIAILVEALTRDLLHLYQLLQEQKLTETDRTVVLPALEQMRNILRGRGRNSRPLRDTLHKAIDRLSLSAS